MKYKILAIICLETTYISQYLWLLTGVAKKEALFRLSIRRTLNNNFQNILISFLPYLHTNNRAGFPHLGGYHGCVICVNVDRDFHWGISQRYRQSWFHSSPILCNEFIIIDFKMKRQYHICQSYLSYVCHLSSLYCHLRRMTL